MHFCYPDILAGSPKKSRSPEVKSGCVLKINIKTSHHYLQWPPVVEIFTSVETLLNLSR